MVDVWADAKIKYDTLNNQEDEDNSNLPGEYVISESDSPGVKAWKSAVNAYNEDIIAQHEQGGEFIGPVEPFVGPKQPSVWEKAEAEFLNPDLSLSRLGGALREGTRDLVRNQLTGTTQLEAAATERAVEHTSRRQEEMQRLRAKTTGQPYEQPKQIYSDKQYLGSLNRVQNAINNTQWLQQNPEYVSSSGFVEDVFRLGPQVVGQMIVGASTGGTGTMPFMGMQIIGSSFEESIKNGADPTRARAAAIANAIMQAPLESISINKTLKFWNLRSSALAKLKEAGATLGTEWLTETLQAFPEEITSIWAEDVDETTLTALVKTIENSGEVFLSGAKDGLVTLPFAAFGLGAGHIIASRKNIQNKKVAADVQGVIGEVKDLQAAPPKPAPVSDSTTFELGGKYSKYNVSDEVVDIKIQKTAKDAGVDPASFDKKAVQREMVAEKAKKDGNLALYRQIKNQSDIDKNIGPTQVDYAQLAEDEVRKKFEQHINSLRTTAEQRLKIVQSYYRKIYTTNQRPTRYIEKIDNKLMAEEIAYLRSLHKTDLAQTSKSAMLDRLNQLNNLSEAERVADIKNTLDAFRKKALLSENTVKRHPKYWYNTIKSVAEYIAITNQNVLQSNNPEAIATAMDAAARKLGINDKYRATNQKETVAVKIGAEKTNLDRELSRVGGYNLLGAETKSSLDSKMQKKLESQVKENTSDVALSKEEQAAVGQAIAANEVKDPVIPPEEYEPSWLQPHMKQAIHAVDPVERLKYQEAGARHNLIFKGIQEGYGPIKPVIMYHVNDATRSDIGVHDISEIPSRVLQHKEAFAEQYKERRKTVVGPGGEEAVFDRRGAEFGREFPESADRRAKKRRKSDRQGIIDDGRASIGPVINNEDGFIEIDIPAIFAAANNFMRSGRVDKSGTPVDPDTIDAKDLKGKKLGSVERYETPPQWLAKKFPNTFGRFFGVQQEREQNYSRNFSRTLEEVTDFFQLKNKEVQQFGRIAFEIENKKLVESNAIIFDENGDIKLNEKHYAELSQWLDANTNAGQRVKDAVVKVRRSLDKDLIAVWNHLNSMKDMDQTVIDELRNSIGRVYNYFPHMRYGDHAAVVKLKGEKDKPGETVYRKHFYYKMPKKLSEAKGKKLVASVLRNDPYFQDLLNKHNIDDFDISYEKVGDIPEDVYSIPIPVEAMEAVINAAIHRIKTNPNLSNDQMTDAIKGFEKALPQAISDTMKTRGWGAHMIQRKNVEGFERDDIKRVLFDYKAGLYGWLSKMDASRKFAEEMYKIDPKGDARIWEATKAYTYNMLANQDKLDRVINNIRAVFFVKYLGANIKTSALNLTQNIIAGWPRLSMEVGGSFIKTLDGVQKQILNEATNKFGAKSNLDEFERKLLFELYEEGDTQSQFINEIRGQLGNNARSMANRATTLMAYPMAIAEKFNRSSLGLAAFKAARDGKITNQKTLGRYGIELGQKLDMSNDEHFAIAKEFAREIIEDAHFLYGKSNRPELFRGGKPARAAAAAYTFRTFTHNLLHLWKYMATNDRGFQAIARSVLGMTVMGGMASLPVYKTFMHLYRQLFGYDLGDDIVQNMVSGSSKALEKIGMSPDEDMLANLYMYGVPSLFNTNLGGSLGMEVPILRTIDFNKAISEQLGRGVMEVIGVPYAVVQDAENFIHFGKLGDWSRAFEYSINAVGNPLKAIRLHEEGARTKTGKPINFPGEAGPLKTSTGEMIAGTIGFPALKQTQSYDIYEKLRDFQSYKTNAQKDFSQRIVHAIIEGGGAEKVKGKIDKIMMEVIGWNNKQLKRGNGLYQITNANLMQSIMHSVKNTNPALYLTKDAIELRRLYRGE